MKKKVLTFLFGLVGVIGMSIAQAQNPECITNLSIFAEHAKVKNYDAAHEPWKMVRDNCPELNSATFVYGNRILEDRIKKASGAEKTSNIQELLKLYDDSYKYFPKKFPLAKVNSDKALLMFNEKLGSDQEIYDLLHTAFTQDRANFKNPRALYLYFSELVNLHNSGNKELQVVFNTYDDVNERIEEESKTLSGTIDKLLPKEEAETLSSKEKRTLKRSRTNLGSYEKIRTSIDSKLGALANCENLIPLYQRNFEENKGDAVWLRRAAGRMDAKECTDDPLFVQLVEALDVIEPSASSKYFLGTLLDKQGKTAEAIDYFNQSVELETDNFKNARTLYKIAVKLKNRQPATARRYAQKALEYQPSLGSAYLLIASLYGNAANQCGETPFEKRSIWWKAAETARRAGRVDPSLKSRANKAANSYAQRAPSKQDIFQAGMSGKTINFKCWVGGSIKVPNL
ncbi:hypothetical protein GTQ40_10530 [Flavobacteriaceae bacterium R38]|nr:hypothetical protein [Flavobacteriaceae bacterium R38]